jgi:hypothetical protein
VVDVDAKTRTMLKLLGDDDDADDDDVEER